MAGVITILRSIDDEQAYTAEENSATPSGGLLPEVYSVRKNTGG